MDAFRGCPRPRGVGVNRSLEEQKHGNCRCRKRRGSNHHGERGQHAGDGEDRFRLRSP